VRDYGYAQYVSALAQGTGPDARARRDAALAEAARVYATLTPEARELRLMRRLGDWIAAGARIEAGLTRAAAHSADDGPMSKLDARACTCRSASRRTATCSRPRSRRCARRYAHSSRSCGARFPTCRLRVISALAEGGDQLVAEEALAAGIELVAPLPMAQAEYERDFTDPAVLARFRALLARATCVCCRWRRGSRPKPSPSPGARDRQYAQLGMFVSSHCQVLLALWDGKPGPAGGTADVVEYHVHDTMPALSAETGRARAARRRRERPRVPHRLLAASTGGTGRAPQRRAGSPRRAHDAPPGMPEPHLGVFARCRRSTATSRATRARSRGAVAAVRAAAAEATAAAHRGARARVPRGRLARGVLPAAACAEACSRRTRSPALMGLAFILFAELGPGACGSRRSWRCSCSGCCWRPWASAASGSAATSTTVASRRAARAPLLAPGRRRDPPDTSLGYESFLQRQDAELSWIRHALRGTGLLRDEDFARIGRGSTGRSRAGSATPRAAAASSTISAAAARGASTRSGAPSAWAGSRCSGGLGVAALLMLGTARSRNRSQRTLMVAMGLLPLLAGIRESYYVQEGSDRELIQAVSSSWRGCSRAVARGSTHARSDAEISWTAARARRACLEEHAEWILLHRERAAEKAQLG
jgi:hypothetical protein